MKQVQLSELEPKEIMDMAIKQYSLDKLYVLFSGGKDSVCVLHFIATNYPDIFGGAVFTNTGLGSQETRKFVINYCKEMGWKLYLTYPQEKERFQKIMLKKLKAGKNVKTHRRDMIILPEMVNKLIKVYNGKSFVTLSIEPEMIGHLFGEFVLTRRRVAHNSPGVGATRSSSNISVK